MLKKLKTDVLLPLLLITVVGFSLRIYKLYDNPPSLNWDEVSHGYNAFSILKVGVDEWGQKFPIIFRAYGDYKLPIYIYVTVVSEAIFGLSEFSVRLPSVLAGTITIFFTYILVKELLASVIENKKLLKLAGLTSALLVAVEPWTLFLSRPAFEANLALTFFITGFYLLLVSRNHYQYLPVSILFLGLSVWTYNSYRIFTSLMLLCCILIYKRDYLLIAKKQAVVTTSAILLFFIIFIPMFVQIFRVSGSARYAKVALIDDGAISKIISLREKYNLSPQLERLLINKYSYFSFKFGQNWLSTFSPSFLFTKGGSNYQFSVPDHGLIYLVNVIPILVGLLVISKKIKKTKIIIAWIFFAPIAASLTREEPHVLRNITLLPIPMLLAGLGTVKIYEYIKHKNSFFSKIVGGVYITILLISLIGYLNIYFNGYRRQFSWSWQYGYKEAVDYSLANYDKYDKIIVTKKYGEPHEFFLFYSKWSPEMYKQDSNLVRYSQSDWFWVDSFDKYVFVNEWDIPVQEWQPFVTEKGVVFDCREMKCLLITDVDRIPKTWSKLKTIKFLDGKTAFEIVENK